MSLKIYNVLTRKKEEFKSLTSGKVRMYVCGITPYDECHLGHARAAVVFDVIYRYLKHLGNDVTYVRNFTDVDDKIIKKAQTSGALWSDISQKYIASYKAAMTKLGVEPPTHEPLCTENIPEMIALIEQLIQRGLAYVAGSDVFFEVRKFKAYGKLSSKKIDDLESGARIEVDEKKKDPLDFALWKGAKPGEPSWESPWGPGRPGWHIECSAMSMKYFGERFDIHGGGRDLIFPHHENEIAQSEGATGEAPFAKYWLHNGFVNINSAKMSKSLGNFRSIPALLEEWDSEIVRYFLLSAHYASPIDFTEEGMTNAREALERFYESYKRFLSLPEGKENLPVADLTSGKVLAALDDDFNTPALIGSLFEAVRTMNKATAVSAASKKSVQEAIAAIGSVIGLFHTDPETFLMRGKSKALETANISEEEISKLLEDRKLARKHKDFKRSDEIRDALAQKNILIKDNPDGTTSWEVKR